MHLRTAALAFALLASGCGSSTAADPPHRPRPVFPSAFRAMDLSRPVHAGAPHVPNAEGFPYERLRLAPGPGGRDEGAFSLVESTGTHVTAPSAFVRDAPDVSAFDASRARPLVVLRSDRGVHDVGVVAAFEATHGRIAPGSVVVLHTGVAERGAAELATTARSGAGWDARVVRFLAAERGVAAVGTDGLTLDPGGTLDGAPAAVAAAQARVMTVSGLSALRHVPPTGAFVVVAPLALSGAGAAPARVVAYVPRDPGSSP